MSHIISSYPSCFSLGDKATTSISPRNPRQKHPQPPHPHSTNPNKTTLKYYYHHLSENGKRKKPKMAVTSAITDLVKSVGELLSSVLGAAYAIVHSFISGLLGLFAGFFAFVGDVGKGVFDLAGGVGKFVAGMYNTSIPFSFSSENSAN
jgi:hypothetical protein